MLQPLGNRRLFFPVSKSSSKGGNGKISLKARRSGGRQGWHFYARQVCRLLNFLVVPFQFGRPQKLKNFSGQFGIAQWHF